MKRLLLVGTALVLVLALAACGGSHKAAVTLTDIRPIRGTPIFNVHAIASARERAAGRKAERLLRRAALPAGAVRVRRLPAGSSQVLLRSQLGVSVLTKIADRRAFWSVGQPVSSVDSFVKTHPTAGLRWGSGGSDGQGPPNASESFYGRLGGGRPVQRFLTISMAREKGKTFIRVDAGAAWVFPRSPRTEIRAPVESIDIHGGAVSKHVTGPRQIRRIVRWFNALNIVQPGQESVGCALVLASRITFVFRSPSGTWTAIVPSQPADWCDQIAFSVNGQRQTPLIDSTPGDGKAFVDRVQRLLGVRFSNRVP